MWEVLQEHSLAQGTSSRGEPKTISHHKFEERGFELSLDCMERMWWDWGLWERERNFSQCLETNINKSQWTEVVRRWAPGRVTRAENPGLHPCWGVAPPTQWALLHQSAVKKMPRRQTMLIENHWPERWMKKHKRWKQAHFSLQSLRRVASVFMLLWPNTWQTQSQGREIYFGSLSQSSVYDSLEIM